MGILDYILPDFLTDEDTYIPEEYQKRYRQPEDRNVGGAMLDAIDVRESPDVMRAADLTSMLPREKLQQMRNTDVNSESIKRALLDAMSLDPTASKEEAKKLKQEANKKMLMANLRNNLDKVITMQGDNLSFSTDKTKGVSKYKEPNYESEAARQRRIAEEMAREKLAIDRLGAESQSRRRAELHGEQMEKIKQLAKASGVPVEVANIEQEGRESLYDKEANRKMLGGLFSSFFSDEDEKAYSDAYNQNLKIMGDPADAARVTKEQLRGRTPTWIERLIEYPIYGGLPKGTRNPDTTNEKHMYYHTDNENPNASLLSKIFGNIF